MILEPGLHLDVPHIDYHADPSARPSLSSHMAGILLSKSPAHAKLAHPRFGGAIHTSTEEQEHNSILHDLILGGGADVVEVKFNDFRNNEAKKARDEARAAGKIPITSAKLDELKAQVSRIMPYLPLDILTGKTEVTAIWESDGCPCRARIDCLDGHTIFDLKFFPGCTPRTVDAAAASNNYFVQAAANLCAINTLIESANGRSRFILVFVDPYCPEIGIIMREVRGQALEVGMSRWNRAKAIWAECLRTGEFPGYPRTVDEVRCPPWILADEMEQQILANDGKEPF